jgi:hypothetical protein
VRASDREREEVASRLSVAAIEGSLETDELEERLKAAYAARTQAALTVLTQDLPSLPSAAVARQSRTPYLAGRRRRRLSEYVVVNALLVCLWLADVGARDPVLVGNTDFFWPAISILGWGGAVGLLTTRERRRPRAAALRELAVGLRPTVLVAEEIRSPRPGTQ